MWWGVIIGLLGLGAGFAILRGQAKFEGIEEEHDRQEAMAEMVAKEIKKKDSAINAETARRLKQIHGLSRLRLNKPKKVTLDARELFSRTKKPWPPKA